MARLFPRRSSTARGDRSPRVVDLADEDADAVFGALSSTTARRIYAAIDDQPRTPSDVAEAIDSSIQNVKYHLEKLEAAGLIEVVDTWYSSRGNEMSVYATVNGPLIVTNDRSKADRVKTALSRYLGGIVALLGMSLLGQYGLAGLFGRDEVGGEPTATGTGDDTDAESVDGLEDTEDGPAADEDGPSPDDGPAADDAEDDGETLQAAQEDAVDEPADDGGDTPPDDGGTTDGMAPTDGGETVAEVVFGTVPPGMVFFFGGAVVLTAVTCYWYWRTY